MDCPVCPHCKYQYRDWWDGNNDKGDGDSWEVDCPNCDKPFKITLWITLTFENEPVVM